MNRQDAAQLEAQLKAERERAEAERQARDAAAAQALKDAQAAIDAGGIETPPGAWGN